MRFSLCLDGKRGATRGGAWRRPNTNQKQKNCAHENEASDVIATEDDREYGIQEITLPPAVSMSDDDYLAALERKRRAKSDDLQNPGKQLLKIMEPMRPKKRARLDKSHLDIPPDMRRQVEFVASFIQKQ